MERGEEGKVRKGKGEEGRERREGRGGKGRRGKGKNTGWPYLQFSLRDATVGNLLTR